MLPASQPWAACTRGTTSPSLPLRGLPPDFISSVSHTLWQVSSSMAGENQGAGAESLHNTLQVPARCGGSRRPPQGSAHRIRSAQTRGVSLQPPPKQGGLFQFLLPTQVSHVPVPSCLLLTDVCVPSPARANIRGKLPLVLMSTVTANTGVHGCTPALVLQNQHLSCIY